MDVLPTGTVIGGEFVVVRPLDEPREDPPRRVRGVEEGDPVGDRCVLTGVESEV